MKNVFSDNERLRDQFRQAFSNLPGLDQVKEMAQQCLNGNSDSLKGITDWVYDRVRYRMPGLEDSQSLAQEYLLREGTLEEQIDALISNQQLRCGANGVVTGVGGFATLPLNLVSSLYLQMRMVAAIAIMCGRDLDDERVKLAVLSCLLGSAALERLGGAVARRVTSKGALKAVPGVGAVVSGVVDAAGTRAIGKAAKKAFLSKPC